MKKSPYGLGIFAKKMIKPGTLLLVDHAFMVVEDKYTNSRKMVFN